MRVERMVYMFTASLLEMCERKMMKATRGRTNWMKCSLYSLGAAKVTMMFALKIAMSQREVSIMRNVRKRPF